jgi:predicted ATPase
MSNQFIKSITVRNFKSIRSADVKLAALNVVVGRNSAGKSSLMHSIMLATQHLSSDFISDDRISLNRNNVLNLGSFREVLNFNEDLNSSVSLGIETDTSTWGIEFVQNRDAEGLPRELSREAITRSIRFTESATPSFRNPLQQFDFSFEIQNFPVRTTPVLLSLASSKRSEMPLAEGNGYARYTTMSSSAEIVRSIDTCLFMPYSQDRIHPLPLENTDFFHLAVERFYSACALRLERVLAMRTRQSGAARLVKQDSTTESISEDQVLTFFEYLITRSNRRESLVNIPEPLKDKIVALAARMQYRDAVEANIIRTMNQIDRFAKFPYQIFDDFNSSSGAREKRELLRVLLESIVALGLSGCKNLLLPVLQRQYGVETLNVFKPLTIEVKFDEDEEQAIASDDLLVEFLQRGRDRLTRSAKNVYYLGPIRDIDYPAWRLPDPRNLGPKGEQAVEVLVHELHTVNDFPLPVGYVSDGSDSAEVDFEKALGAWLQHFELAKGVRSVDQGRDKPRMVVRIDDSENEVDLRSVGQGLSQMLPVLMQCLLAAPGSSLVIVEQPELHLHPKLESQLADFFLACARSGRQIFVETHSEHLINRLRLRIAKDPTDVTSDLIQVLFADQVNGVTNFEKANIDKYGGLVKEQWPPGFLELNLAAAETLVDAALDKRISELESLDLKDDDEDEDF